MEAAERSLLCQLQCAFREIVVQQASYSDTLDLAADALSLLQNLAEQYSSCAAADLATTPFAELPGIQSALLAKLIAAMEMCVTKLRNALCSLSDASCVVRAQSTSCMRVYTQTSGVLTVECSTRLHPLWPTLATMLQNVALIDKLFHQDFLTKEYFFDGLSYDDSSSVECLAKAWKKDRKMNLQIKEILALVSFLVKEEL